MAVNLSNRAERKRRIEDMLATLKTLVKLIDESSSPILELKGSRNLTKVQYDEWSDLRESVEEEIEKVYKRIDNFLYNYLMKEGELENE